MTKERDDDSRAELERLRRELAEHQRIERERAARRQRELDEQAGR